MDRIGTAYIENPDLQYSFRPASFDDFKFIFELKKQNFKYYVDKILGWEDNDEKQKLKQDLEEHLEHKKIITLNYKEIGIYVTHITVNGDMFINEISLLKEYQNKGIGTDILKKELEENKQKKIRTILQVFKDNKAKNLYEKLDFKVYGETETHYQMEKI